MKVDTDPKGRFVSFKFAPSNDRVLSFYAPSGYSTREKLDRVPFFEGPQNYMENKNKLNKNKIILEDFNCTMDKMARDGENKTQRLYWCCSSYALSKLILDNGLRIYREGRTQIPLSSPPTIRPLARIQDLFCQGSIDISPSKTKIEKDSRKRFIKVILFYVSPSTPQLQRRLFFITNTKNNHPSASHW